jgi:hypothetical protein
MDHTLSPDLPPNEILRQAWHGNLTGDTANTIAAYLELWFGGDQRFSLVRASQTFDFEPDQRTGLRLTVPVQVDVIAEPFQVQIQIETPGGYLRFKGTERAGREVNEGPCLNPSLRGLSRPAYAVRGPHFHFGDNLRLGEPSRQRQVRIKGLDDCDAVVYTVLTVEEPRDLEIDR